MGSTIEHAREGLEHAHEAAEGHAEHGDTGARKIAVLISVLAATLAIAEMEKNGAQTEYLTHHIERSDDYAFYQAKKVRSDMASRQAGTLESLPSAADPEVRKRIDAARAEKARLDDDEKGDGLKQLRAKADEDTHLRDEALHHYHHYEFVVGALQIAIVLASVSVVTRVKLLAWIGGVMGGVAVLYGLALAGGMA